MSNRLGVNVFIKETLHLFEIDTNVMNMENNGDWRWVGISGAKNQRAITDIYLLTAGNYQKVKSTLAQLCSCVEPSLAFATRTTSKHQRIM